jgi:hypothetical protein
MPVPQIDRGLPGETDTRDDIFSTTASVPVIDGSSAPEGNSLGSTIGKPFFKRLFYLAKTFSSVFIFVNK